MMFLRISVLAAALLQAASTVHAQATKQIAVTFDDLPYVAAGQTWTLPRAQRVADAVLAVLEDFRAPATAFVNEAQLHATGEIEARTALLARWADAGVILGNHTYSHADLNTVSVEAFKEEILKGEVISRELMAAHGDYRLYFRHPQTHTGDTAEKKAAIDAFLSERGYTVAPHTVDSQDFIFNLPYIVARNDGDIALAQRLCTAYAEFVAAATDFAETTAPLIFGRPIPQILLVHANDINADCLDELLASLRERQYRFVTLDAALADPAYRTPDTTVTAFGPTWLSRWSRSLELRIDFRGDPEPPEWVVDEFRKSLQQEDRALPQ